MKFTVSQSSLMKALSVVSKGMGNNSTLPILSGIYLRAENGSVELQTNNLSISIRHVVAANVEEPGETVVSGKILINIVKTLSDSAVTFEESGRMVTISCEKSTFRLNTLSARDWPAWSEIEPERTIELPSALLSKMVDKVYRVTSKEPTRQFLQGIQITVENNTIRLVATDSFRLAVCDSTVEAAPEELRAAVQEIMPQWRKNYEEVKALGGLYIIGSERHESRRIDNQLRGRSGRQGDPGSSRFFVSMEDSLMRLFASDTVRSLVGRLGMSDGSPIENKMLTNAIEKAQMRVEERNFEIRKRLLDYDDVLNEERNYIYEQRDEILSSDDLSGRIRENCRIFTQSLYEETQKDGASRFREALQHTFTTNFDLTDEEYETKPVDTVCQRIDAIIEDKEKLIGKANFNLFLRSVYLRNIDRRWIDHLDVLDELKDASQLKSYAQKNPLIEYKNEASDAYDRMLEEISENVCRMAVAAKFVLKAANHSPSHQKLVLSKPSAGQPTAPQRNEKPVTASAMNTTTVVRSTPKVGRNDPCPCGSGKKYKNCCGRNA